MPANKSVALKNVMQPLVYRHIKRAERNEMAAEALDRVGLGDRLDSLPNQMSGGQRQRVAISRALVGNPAILLADEPTGNLDSKTGGEILQFMQEAVRDLDQTIVMVTHDPSAAAHADRVVFLADGRIVQELITPSADLILDTMKRLGD